MRPIPDYESMLRVFAPAIALEQDVHSQLGLPVEAWLLPNDVLPGLTEFHGLPVVRSNAIGQVMLAIGVPNVP